MRQEARKLQGLTTGAGAHINCEPLRADGDKTFAGVVAKEVGAISVLARITDHSEGLVTPALYGIELDTVTESTVDEPPVFARRITHLRSYLGAYPGAADASATTPGAGSGHRPPNPEPSRSPPCATQPPRSPPSASSPTLTTANLRPGRSTELDTDAHCGWLSCMADANEEAAASRVYDTLAPATDRVSNVRDASDPAGDVTTGMIWAASPASGRTLATGLAAPGRRCRPDVLVAHCVSRPTALPRVSWLP